MLLQRAIDAAGFQNFREFHQWSYLHPDEFWRQAWDDLSIVGSRGDQVYSGDDFENRTWFPDSRLNVTETLLAGEPNQEVLVALSESGERKSFSRSQLIAEVAACAAAMRAEGVEVGDRVAAITPNIFETVIFALAGLSIGAVISTASSDFGHVALVDRFAQIEPKLLLTTESYQYGGRNFDFSETLEKVLAELPTVAKVIVVGETGKYANWETWLSEHRGAEFEPILLPFSHPGFILFSSGTTGKPKCIVHSAAGVLLKVLSEQGYHLNINSGDRVFYSTTCGWMMWNWLMLALGRGATIVLFDGSPGYPKLDRLWEIAEQEELSFLGVSAALIDTWRKADLQPKQNLELRSLRTIASTGSPLSKSGFDWVGSAISESISVASIAGGTDLCGCLVLGVATEKVTAGEIQGPALGLDVVVVDDDGFEVGVGEQGELVCRTPFPSVPLSFWGDDGSKRHNAYFSRHEGIWAHGDFAKRTPSGGFEILGRLDATLNVKGVRIGTAEIYRVVLAIPGISEALAVEQPTPEGSQIALFVITDNPVDSELEANIRASLRTQASPRHVPAVIVRAPELPKTRSGKTPELAISDIVAGRKERDVSGLANPQSLQWFRDWAKQGLTGAAE